jgi:hypothetical protein
MYYKPLNVTIEDIPRTVSPFGMAEIDNTLFGRSGKKVVKSVDGGRLFTDWFIPLDADLISLMSVIAVNENKVIAGYSSTVSQKEGFYLIEKLGEISTIRFLGIKNVDWPGISFGQERYPRYGSGNKIILIGEYGTRDAPNYARHLYLYDESIDTFRIIFELPEIVPNRTHLHGAHYDWRADTIWVCGGDAEAVSTWYSTNWREAVPTWNRVWTGGLDPVQFTSIYSTSNQILLGSDGVGDDGLYALNRTPNNVYQNPSLIKLMHLRNYVDANGIPLVARTFLETTDGAIFVPFSSKTAFPSVILGTKDGVKWYKIYETTEVEVSVVNMVGNKMIIMVGTKFRLIDVEWERIMQSDVIMTGTLVGNFEGVKIIKPIFNNGNIVVGNMIYGK